MRLNGSQSVDDVPRLAEVDLVESVPDLVLHVLHQTTNIGNVRTGLADGTVLLHLSGEGPPEVHGAGPRLVGLQPEHTGAGQLVVSVAAGTLLLDLNNVNGVPTSFDLLGVPVTGLLDENDPSKAMI